MINFKQYLVEEENKATDEQIKDTVVRKADKELTLEEVVKTAKPTIWTAREVKNNKYLIYNNKYLNITKLKKEMDLIYSNNGYADYGFSKLSESELVRYTSVKDVLMTFFTSSITDEIEPEAVANKLFLSELKEFDWKPEEY